MRSSRATRRRSLVAAALAALVVVSAGGMATAAGAPAVPPPSTNGNPPACRIADRVAKFTRTSDWSRTLVDWTLKVGSSYRPPTLVPVSRAGLSGGGSVRAELIPDLRAMASAARAARAPLAVQSAYRSYATQVSTFSMWVSRYGYATAIVGSARPGHSEHQLGTTLDFKSYGGRAPWAIGGYDWATSRAGRWMMANAWKYGFVLSYPKGKRAQVCYGYEPWHYRYFGRTVARAMHLSAQTTRVWLWRHGNSPITLPLPTPPPGATPTPTPSPSLAPEGSPSPVPSPSLAPETSPETSADPVVAPASDPPADGAPSADPETETP